MSREKLIGFIRFIFLLRRYGQIGRFLIRVVHFFRRSLLMFCSTLKRRPGFSLVELLVVIAIIGVLTGLLLSAVNQAMAAAQMLQCSHNLRQLGIALHLHNETVSALPTENGSDRTVYRALLPFIEQQGVEHDIQAGVPNAERAAIALFLCASRRKTSNAPGKRDYGYALAPNNSSVLDSPHGLHLGAITNASGTANTLLLSHVWMAPDTYFGGAPAGTDTGWFHKENGRSVSDTARADGDRSGTTNHIGGPHAHVVPSLFADGHVSGIPLVYQQWASIWAWNHRGAIRLPD